MAERAGRILACVEEYRETEGIAPTEEEIAARTGIPRSTVTRYLARLKSEGMILYAGRRSIRPISPAAQELCGVIACGERRETVPVPGETAEVPFILRSGYFLLRAKGDSMRGAGIESGDVLILRQQRTAENGEIAAVLVDGESTLKRFYREPGSPVVELRPENSDYAVQTVDLREHCFAVQGVLTGVYRGI